MANWAVGFFLFTILPFTTKGQSVDLVLRPTSTPVKGSTVQIICPITDYNTSLIASVYRLVSQNDNATSQREVSLCIKTRCVRGTSSRSGYTSTRNNTGIYLSITNVARDNDTGWWMCGLASIAPVVTSDRKLLDVYTSPGGVAYTNQPTNAQDLGLVDVTLSCQTSECAYPAANFTWYYTDSTGMNVYSESGVAVSDSSCASHEKKYSSTLSLSRYTEFTGNVPKTTHFQCGLTHATLPNEVFTSQSASIKFAVRVTSLTLIETSNNVAVGAELRALIDSNKSLTVVWSPVSSNPQPTITCYIGTVSTLLSGSGITFSVGEQDHNKDIYCSATNSVSGSVSSASTKLYVIVPLTDVTLTHNGVALETGTQVRVKQGTSVSLKLSFTPAVTRPSPTVTCYVGTNEVQGDTFTITARNEDHGKSIYCKATSTNMRETKRAQLYVIVEVTTFNIVNTSLILLDGTPAKASCVTTAATRPEASIIWEINGNPLSEVHTDRSIANTNMFSVTSTVTFTPSRGYDGQLLKCKAKVETQSYITTTKQMTVWHSPDKPTVKPNTPFPWLKGNSRHLSCWTSDRGKPISSVMWSETTSGTVNGDTIQFQSLTSDDNSMNVSCELHNNFTIITRTTAISDPLILNIEYKPKVRIHYKGHETDGPVTIREGLNVSVLCQASGNPTPTSVKWQSMNTETLTFLDVNRTDAGNYQCDASASSQQNGPLSSSKQIQLVVKYAPDISVRLSNIRVIAESKVTIICDPHGIPDSYNYQRFVHTWRGKHIRDLPGNKTFDIPAVALQDSGTYTCFADNTIADRHGVIDQQGSTSLQIEASPMVLKSKPFKYSGEPGKSATISIPFYSNPPITSLVFGRGSDVLQNSSQTEIYHNSTRVSTLFYGVEVVLDGYSANLILHNLTESDFGNYTIQLRNSIGNTMANPLEFLASSEPMPPTEFIVIQSITNRDVKVQWTSGFNGGHQQTFVLQYRRSNENSWTTAINVTEDDQRYRLQNGTYTANVTGLQAGTYLFQLFAVNSEGRSGNIEMEHIIIPEDKDQTVSLPVAAIAGGVGAAVFVIVVVILVVFLVRRFRPSKDPMSDDIHLSKKPTEEEDEDVIVINDIYDGRPVRGAVAQTPSVSGTSDENYTYAEVKKTPKSDLYAEVVKTKKTNGKFQVGKGSPKKTSGTETVYENPGAVIPTGNDESVYENHDQAVKRNANQVPKKRNIGELPYTQIEFAKQKGGKKKIIIHGIDDKTEYAEVAFGKVGQKAPESDEEEPAGTDTK